MRVEPNKLVYKIKGPGYFRCMNPTLVMDIVEREYYPGPKPQSEKIKRWLYDHFRRYHDWYDRKYGKTSETYVHRAADLSDTKWQKLVLNMALNGDFTLQQALYTVAHACPRCRKELMAKYCREYENEAEVKKDGYNGCCFCSGGRWSWRR